MRSNTLTRVSNNPGAVQSGWSTIIRWIAFGTPRLALNINPLRY